MAPPPPVVKNPNISKRQTGTVPKTTTSSNPAQTTARPTNSAAPSRTSSRKNTEIVAPTRRELNDLNDFFLSVAESTKQQNNSGGIINGGSSVPALNSHNIENSHLDTSCLDLDNLNFHENQQRFWPVRPIPRRNEAKNTSDSNVQSEREIGVVLPTTPNAIVLDESSIPSSNRSSHGGVGGGGTASASNNINSLTNHHNSQNFVDELSNLNLDSDLTWEQRLNFIQYFLSLTSKTGNNKEDISAENESDYCIKLFDTKPIKMVNEYNTSNDVYNSTSLEDVARSESSDGRAQSVQSIHTITSVPNTPTYEELQTKLEASSRNMQNIKEQQNQLIRLQQAAKQHLTEMESIRTQARQPAHFNQNGSAPPDYESVEEVHSDMSNLVNRMKALTTFIQGQHELSNLLGEDGPEVLAEQQALHEKLQELRVKKQEMQNLVSELQTINAESEAAAASSPNNDQQINNHHHDEDVKPRVVAIEYERVVPIELIGNSKHQQLNQNSLSPNSYANGIHTTSGGIEHDDSEDHIEQLTEEKEAAQDLIRQKMIDINTMKSQLKRLRDMMETVQLIETKTDGKSVKEIAAEGERTQRGGSIPRGTGTARALPSATADVSQYSEPEKDGSQTPTREEEEMSERVRMLHEMTQDLRDQAVNLAAERDRLAAIKEEMKRRQEIEAVTASKTSNQETANTSHSSSSANLNSKYNEKLLLKVEYEAKKKEFEKLCQRLENEVQDDEDDNQAEESDAFNTTTDRFVKREQFADTWNNISPNSSTQGVPSAGSDTNKKPTIPPPPTALNRGKESVDSVVADVNGIASLEARSFQSGSSRSFSMPPPMRTLSTRETAWRKNSQDNNSQSQFDHYAPAPPPLPIWNPNYYYSTPYSQQFSPHCHHHMMVAPGSNIGSDYFCSHQTHASSVSAGVNNTPNVAQTNQSTGISSADPVLLQQFIQTQQMLINSVCQCNQLLWHQQREINNLNNAVLLLQERLLNQQSTNFGGESLTSRSESVPPTAVTVANNLYATAAAGTAVHRAQSEQPIAQNCPTGIPIQVPMSPLRQCQSFNYNNVCLHQQQQQQQRRNITSNQQGHLQSSTSNSAYNFTSSAEQEAAVFVANNATTNGQFLNNDGTHSMNLQNPAPPIFMHHHNNTTTQIPSSTAGASVNNHSNLLNMHQNCLNSPQNTQNVPSNTTNNAAASALNNQVPPGNRTNNYWDNFRSYSRQNLLSTNSCKSNEDQHNQQQQQHQTNSSVFDAPNISSAVYNVGRNLQQCNNPITPANVCRSSSNTSINNLAAAQQSFDSKFLHLRNQLINRNSTANAQQFNVAAATNPPSSSIPGHQQQINETLATTTDLNNLQLEIFNTNNNSSTPQSLQNNVAAILANPDQRNMNFNIEVSKKMPVKASCSYKHLRHGQPTIGNDVNFSTQYSNDFTNEYERQFDYNHRDAVSPPNQHHHNPHSGAASSLSSTAAAAAAAAASYQTNNISDELKKNLLVNAIKSDKFTSKFFETLKEDVYRELFNELQLITNSEPLRNIIMQTIHDLYKRSTSNEENSANSAAVDAQNYGGGIEVPILQNALPPPEVNNVVQPARDLDIRHHQENDSEIAVAGSNLNQEVMNSLLNSQELRRLAYKVMYESSTLANDDANNRDGRLGNSFGEDEASSTENTRQQQSISAEIYQPDYELIDQIMTNVRNSIHSQAIDDIVMARIAKVTSATLEKFCSTERSIVQSNRDKQFSPRESYKVMKTFQNHDRDSFLLRYETYLQSLFIIKISPEDSNGLAVRNSSASSMQRESNFLNLNGTVSKRSCIGIGGGGWALNDQFFKSRVTSSTDSNWKSERNHDLNASTSSASGKVSSSADKITIPDLITTADVGLALGNSSALVHSSSTNNNNNNNNNNANSSNNVNDQNSPNNNMTNDLAEADQICPSSTANNNSRGIVAGQPGQPPTISTITTTNNLGGRPMHHIISAMQDYLDDNHHQRHICDSESTQRQNEAEEDHFATFPMKFTAKYGGGCTTATSTVNNHQENCENLSLNTQAVPLEKNDEQNPENEGACASIISANSSPEEDSDSLAVVPLNTSTDENSSATGGAQTDGKERNIT